MIRTVLAIAVAGLASAPAFALDDISCSDFMAMDSAGQAQAVADMDAGMADGGMMSSGSMMSATDPGGMTGGMMPEEIVAALAATCAQRPELMLGEAMGMPPG
jgi:hypothetical protein